ncbi:MAG: IMP cyclohydrolase [Bulleidia sp.]
MMNLNEYLQGNEYPGRGIVVGRSACGKKMRIAYWIMGRSENSRNRVFVEEGAGIRTQAFDPSKLEDPSLIIYAPVKVLGKTTIVTNGDQTDTVYDFMKEGKTPEEALRTREYEPDGPNWTPRISAVIKGTSVQMSILKSADIEGSSCLRYFFEYEDMKAGTGRFISTYQTNGNPIPSFQGEPLCVEMACQPFDEWSEGIWNSLNCDNRVSLFTRSIDLESGETETRIYNKNR